MNRQSCWGLLGIICCLFVWQVFAADRSTMAKQLANDAGRPMGDYRALVIGVNHYQDKKIPNLKTAVNDAQKITQVLTSIYGFNKVEQLLNDEASSRSIQKALRRLATQSKRDDSVLIYFAGHGDQDTLTGDGWWVPSDATSGDPSTYIDNTIIQKYVRAIPARHVLLISDSCFSGTLFGQARALPKVIDNKYYATLYRDRSRWGITSGNLTPVSDSGSEGHSIFAWQFIRALEGNTKSYTTPREIYQKIAPVIRNSSEQMPITNPLKHAGDAGGEFVFIRALPQSKQAKPAPVKLAPTQSKAPTSPTGTEGFAMWQVIRDSNSKDELQLFVDTYPNSPFKPLALKRLNNFETPKLEQPVKPPVAQATSPYSSRLKPSSKVKDNTALRYIKMLTQNNNRSIKQGAQSIYKTSKFTPEVLDVAAEVLLQRYPRAGRYDVDTLSWLCKTIGRSGNNRYYSALQEVAKRTTHKKLRKYAKAAIKQVGRPNKTQYMKGDVDLEDYR